MPDKRQERGDGGGGLVQGVQARLELLQEEALLCREMFGEVSEGDGGVSSGRRRGRGGGVGGGVRDPEGGGGERELERVVVGEGEGLRRGGGEGPAGGVREVGDLRCWVGEIS